MKTVPTKPELRHWPRRLMALLWTCPCGKSMRNESADVLDRGPGEYRCEEGHRWTYTGSGWASQERAVA